MAVLCVADEHGGLIKKERKKRESSWVKLKAFPTNLGKNIVLKQAVVFSNDL